jgi:predicted TIM-barrel fold metal-dependent hydrolase
MVATQGQEARTADVYAGLKVVDTDTHYTEPPDLWTSRAPGKFKDRMPRVVKGVERPQWVINGDQFFSFAGAASVVYPDGTKESFYDMDISRGRTIDEVHPASYDPKARLKLMDEHGIWAHIVYPNVAGFGAQHLMKIDDMELRNAVVTVYNDAIAELQTQSNNRIFPMALLPWWDVPASVNEVERAKSMGLRGVIMCSDPDEAGMPDIPDRAWDPLWEACGELEMPINFHIGASNRSSRVSQEGRWPSLDWHGAHVSAMVSLEMANSRVLGNLLVSDVLPRFPKTRWVSVESGIGWIPYMLERIEYQLYETLPKDEAQIRPRPTDLFRRQCYACFWFEGVAPRKLLDDIGVENVLWETDFPHATCLYPNDRERAAEVLGDQPRAVQQKILQDNAVKLYHLPV